MITVGSFQFSEDKAFSEVRVVEALSRVRKEITIHALLDGFQDENALFQAVEKLEKELEKMDQGEESISLKTGRYYTGKRRDYVRLVHEKLGLATVKLVVLTEDRYERSSIVHSTVFSSLNNGWEWDIHPNGNWKSWPVLNLEAGSEMTNPRVDDGSRVFSYNGNLNTGDYLIIDSENHTVKKNDTENVLNDVSGEFPLLEPGGTSLVCSFDGGGSPTGTMTVTYRDIWV